MSISSKFNQLAFPAFIAGTTFLTLCTRDWLETQTPQDSNEIAKTEVAAPKQDLCDKFSKDLSDFRKEIVATTTKVNFNSGNSVRKSFAESGIEGKINFASAPASFVRDDGFKVRNSTASIDLDSGTKLMSGYFMQPYGKVLGTFAYKNKIKNVDKNKPSLSFDDSDFGHKEYPVNKDIKVEFANESDKCPGIVPVKK